MNLTARNIIQHCCEMPREVATWLCAGMDEAAQAAIASLNSDTAAAQVKQHVAAALRRLADEYAGK